MVEESKCLVSIFKKCKQSSKEAVENLDLFSEFKEYMHVKRPVEEELENLIYKSKVSETSQLILVCGGVGDGKSHIISYLKKRMHFLEESFYLHNDATESFEPQKTSIETLSEVLAGFSDEGLIKCKNEKVILAINLGALNNFIDSEEGKSFSRLKEYVLEKEILESTISNCEFESNSSFQFINFSDYHMFQLTSEGPKSDYIKQILMKITEPQNENPFYQVYENYCNSGCPAAFKCPIKQNFELLQENNIHEKIIALLIQIIIKEKQIISTRALLNFIHDIVIPSKFESTPESIVISNILDQSFSEYISCLFPMLMFEKSDISSFQRALNMISPLILRTESLDNHYIEFKSRRDSATIFKEYINMDAVPYVSNELNINSPWLVSNNENTELRQTLIKLFVYLYYFIPITDNTCFVDKDYEQFTKYLFHWNNNDVGKLSKLYNSEVRDAIYKWNGEGNGEMIYVQIGQAQTVYRSLQRLEIEPCITRITPKNDKDIFKFLSSMNLLYKAKGTDGKQTEIDLDYSLYCLLIRIKDGYRPNQNDKFRLIKFVEFVDHLCKYGNQREEIIFEEKYISKTSRFALKYDSNFNEYKFMEV
jgi:DNA phosphorothioation-dependent restriction protein DptF